MDIPRWAAECKECFALWIAMHGGAGPGEYAVEIGKELMSDVRAGLPTDLTMVVVLDE